MSGAVERDHRKAAVGAKPCVGGGRRVSGTWGTWGFRNHLSSPSSLPLPGIAHASLFQNSWPSPLPPILSFGWDRGQAWPLRLGQLQ